MADPMPWMPVDRPYGLIRRDSRRFDVSGGPRHDNHLYVVSWVSEGRLEVAIEVGFPDPSRFARAFARRFGATPRAWRARNA